MDNQQNSKTLLESVNSWIKGSVMLKLLTILILALILLIPTGMIRDVIRERQALRDTAIYDVESKWAHQQTIFGPVLCVPFEFVNKLGAEPTLERKIAYFLPEDLNIEGEVYPEELKRGIYKVVVYDSEMTIKGSFKEVVKINHRNIHEILWDEARLVMGISDLRGVKSEMNMQWGEGMLEAEPGTGDQSVIQKGVSFPLNEALLKEEVSFSMKVTMQGSEAMEFIPVGKTTSVHFNSPWTSPKFDGMFLPEFRDVSDNGFEVKWKVLQINRNFPQQWIGDISNESITSNAFGMKLIMDMDDYKKSMRTAKYALLSIFLTFMVFFLVEILNRQKIHPLQYSLVGLALCVFFILLVSLSEHMSFDHAYLLSAIAICCMIFLYSRSVFTKTKYSLMLLLVLIFIYSFLYVTLQLVDYALVMGSLGLFVMLSLSMYLTRNIDWYHITRNTEPPVIDEVEE